jgi:hypothetical protein
MAEGAVIAALAAACGADAMQVGAFVDDLATRAGGRWFYVFRQSGGASGGGTGRPRTILAFAEPDAALAFAQRSLAPGERTPRLRRLGLAHLLLLLARDSRIAAVVLVPEADEMPAGRLPNGVRVERSELLARLR